MAIYKARKGADYGKKQAQMLGELLESLGEQVTPQQVVDAVRSDDHPLHDLFEWDDTEAAEKYRQWQARRHIGCLEIVVVSESGSKETRAFHNVVISREDESHRGYAHMIDVNRTPELREQVIARALREIEYWQGKYSEYQDVLGGVFTAIEKAKRRTKKKELVA